MATTSGEQITPTQEAAVAALIQNDDAEEWAKGRTGWNADSKAQVCTWNGVECDPIEDAVTKISIPGEGLRATIPPELGSLSSLTELDLSENALYGVVPPEVTSLPALERLDLSGNDLTGTIPPFSSSDDDSSSSASARPLHTLLLEKNRLVGPAFPPSLTESCTNLVKLDLSHNGLTGTVPTSLGSSLQFLKYLDVSFNDVGGSIPSDVGQLKELMGLFLNNNELVGTIPPSLGHDDLEIVQLFLEHNRLSGTVPASLADLPRLVDLFIDGNKFTGTVPSDLCVLNLNDDFFQGDHADEGDEGSRDGCNSIACPVNTVSKEGVHPCYECGPQGFNPYLGRNGRCYHVNEKMILDILYDRTDGPTWLGGAGWGITDVPKCDYEGVSCNDAGHVVNITLPRMNLRNEIPDEIGYLRHLRYLDLSDNVLTGYIPSDLRWAPLEVLDVSGNRLKGFVPPMLCLTGDVNGNGANGDYNCDNVACAAGSYSPIGRATARGDTAVDSSFPGLTAMSYQCLPCPRGAPHVGSKVCALAPGETIVTATAKAILSRPVTTNVAGVLVGVLLAAICVPAIALIQFRRWRDSHYVLDQDDDDGMSAYSYGEEDDAYSRRSVDGGGYNKGYRGEREALDAGVVTVPPPSTMALIVGATEAEEEREYGPSEGLGLTSPPTSAADPPRELPRASSQCDDGGADGGSVRSSRSSGSRRSEGSGQRVPRPTVAAPATAGGASDAPDEKDDRSLGGKEDFWLDVPEIT